MLFILSCLPSIIVPQSLRSLTLNVNGIDDSLQIQYILLVVVLFCYVMLHINVI